MGESIGIGPVHYEGAKALLRANSVKMEAIARNVANLGVKDAKRSDLDSSFQDEFNKIYRSGKTSQLSELKPVIKESLEVDKINLEQEMGELSKASLLHDTLIMTITDEMKLISSAINGKTA